MASIRMKQKHMQRVILAFPWGEMMVKIKDSNCLRPPPTLIQFLPGEIKLAAVADEQKDRDEILRQFKYNLTKAQQRMAASANKHRRPLEFQGYDLVFLKVRPHRQLSLCQRVYSKLQPRYYGPFRILKKFSKLV